VWTGPYLHGDTVALQQRHGKRPGLGEGRVVDVVHIEAVRGVAALDPDVGGRVLRTHDGGRRPGKAITRVEVDVGRALRLGA
jgi:hypothetical protein